MSKIDDLITDGKIVAYYDYRSNSLADQSGNQFTATGGDMIYERTAKGRAVKFELPDRGLQTLYAASLNTVERTLLFFGQFDSRSATATPNFLYSMADGSNTNCKVSFNSSGGLTTHDDTGTSANTTDILVDFPYMVGVVIQDGYPLLYKDGQYYGRGASLMVADTDYEKNMYVGGDYQTGYGSDTTLWGFIQANTQLTPQEIAEVTEDFMSRGGQQLPMAGGFFYNSWDTTDQKLYKRFDARHFPTNFVTDTTSNSNHLNDTEFRTSNGSIRIIILSGANWVQGTSSVPNITLDSSQMSGTWVARIYRETTSAALYVKLTGDTVGAGVQDDGYTLAFETDGSLSLYKDSSTKLWQTAASYLAEATNYYLAVVRTAAGVTTTYVKGGTFTEWTQVDVSGGSGSNPVTDTTHTLSTISAVEVPTLARLQTLDLYESELTTTQLTNLY